MPRRHEPREDRLAEADQRDEGEEPVTPAGVSCGATRGGSAHDPTVVTVAEGRALRRHADVRLRRRDAVARARSEDRRPPGGHVAGPVPREGRPSAAPPPPPRRWRPRGLPSTP